MRSQSVVFVGAVLLLLGEPREATGQVQLGSPDAEHTVSLREGVPGESAVQTESSGRLGPNFRVSGGAATSTEWEPAVAHSTIANQYLVVWLDWRNSFTHGSDIYGQRVSATGARLGPDVRITGEAATADDYSPAVAYNATANQYLVVWTDGRNEPTRGYDICGQRVSAAGALLGPNFRISGGAATTTEASPAVAYNATANQYLVVWTDGRNEPTRGYDIYGQRVSAAGARLGSNVRISGGAATANNWAPAVAFDATGNQYLVVWMDERNYSIRGYDIYGQRVSAASTRVGLNIRISSGAATAREMAPAVAYNATVNQYLVVWQDTRNFSTRGQDIYGQRVSAAAARLGPNVRISGGAATADDWKPTVACDLTANQYLVVWEDYRNESTRGRDTYGQRVSATGARLGPNVRISGGAATADEVDPAVAYNATANQYLVVWNDGRNNPTRGRDIYGQRWSS